MSNKNKNKNIQAVVRQAPPPAPQAADLARQLEQVVRTAEEMIGRPVTPSAPDPQLSADKILEFATGAFKELRLLKQRALENADAAQKQRSEADRALAEAREKRTAVDIDGMALAERERSLRDEATTLASARVNAENGFLDERRRILSGVEEQARRLREERDGLLVQVESRRREADRARETAAEAHAASERDADAKRTLQYEEAREALRRDLESVRSDRLASLKLELEGRREMEDARRVEAAAEFDRERGELETQRSRIRIEQTRLAAEQQIVEEDRAAVPQKVERFAAHRIAELEADKAALEAQCAAAKSGRDGYFRELEAHREIHRRLGDRPAEEIINELGRLREQCSELRTELGTRLDVSSEERLETLERERESLLDERDATRQELASVKQRLGRELTGAVELEGVKKEREALQATNKLLRTAVDELRRDVDRYSQADTSRNPYESLLALDRSPELQQERQTVAPLSGSTPTLRTFAEDLRHRLATGVPGRKLYYSPRDVRCWLAGLHMSRLVLLQGISGTGKTSLPQAFAKAVEGATQIVPVQAGWRDRTDLLGHFNAFHRKYYPTKFLEALYRAGTPAFADRPFLIILDEINLSRVEQFFADVLSSLELPEDQRLLTLMEESIPDGPKLLVDGSLRIPKNVWFVGTANHDETTTGFADKTYDRAHVMELPRRDPKTDVFEIARTAAREPISYGAMIAAFVASEDRCRAQTDAALGWLHETPIVRLLSDGFRIGWGNRLEDQAARYIPVVVDSGGSPGEAVDHLLATRVLRKLVDRHDVRPKGLKELERELRASWSKLDPKVPPAKCLELIDAELRTKGAEDAE